MGGFDIITKLSNFINLHVLTKFTFFLKKGKQCHIAILHWKIGLSFKSLNNLHDIIINANMPTHTLQFNSFIFLMNNVDGFTYNKLLTARGCHHTAAHNSAFAIGFTFHFYRFVIYDYDMFISSFFPIISTFFCFCLAIDAFKKY